MKKMECKARVKRMLMGDLRQEYFCIILHFLRNNSFGMNIVKDVANFYSHGDCRDNGKISERVNDIYRLINFHAIRGCIGSRHAIDKLPADAFDVMLAVTRTTDVDSFKQITGLGKQQAVGKIEQIRHKLCKTGGVHIDLTRLGINEDDLNLARKLLNVIPSNHSYTDDDFF